MGANKSSNFGRMSHPATVPILIMLARVILDGMRATSAPDPIELRLRDHLAGVLQSAGVDERFVRKTFGRISEALDAHRVQRINVGEGKIREFSDVDHNVRLAATDRALDLATRAGIIPAPADARRATGGPAISVNIVVLASDGTKSVVKIESNDAK